MKRMKRTLSLLLALVMLLSILPELHLPARAADPEEDETDITVDFEYAEKHGIQAPEDALKVEAQKLFSSSQVPSEAELRRNYDQFYWRKATSWTVNDVDEASLRQYITSIDPKDKYIALNNDDVHDFYKSALWETMEISTDKVLDLNGHQFLIRYDSNRSNDDTSQTDRIEYHNCLAFEIKDGATLTIIDSSAWRGANGGKGTGKLSFTGYGINPFKHNINVYTTRDLFKVTNGNLVIYGGTFQAGRQKTWYKSNFTWEKFKTVIGTAVELGVSVAEYATGIDIASDAYDSLLKSQKNPAANGITGDSPDEDDGTSGVESTVKKDGTDAPKEDKKDSPTGAANANKSVDEKQAGKNDGENKANAKKTGKDDKKTTVAEARKNVVDAAVNQKGIEGMVNKIFKLGKNIANMCGKDKSSFVVQNILGTVVKVDNLGTFVAYGGTFHGYGSTPNTRNAVIEVAYNEGTKTAWDDSKVMGGLAYIYGGTFEGFAGANIFNFVHTDGGPQYASQIAVNEDGSHPQKVEDGKTVDAKQSVKLDESETGGVEIVYYDNQKQLGQPGVEPILVNTANVQVRGGVFRNHYELQNVAIKQKDDSEKFSKFPGTNGTVNLGIESFGEQLIQDGRIQIVDKYGDGALVLLDKQTAEREAALAAGKTFTEGLYRYRLLCGDTELRCKSYLEVGPNEAATNATKSMQLTGYGGDGNPVALLWTDEEGVNERAPLRQTENYFDFVYDDPDKSQSYYVMPKFHDPTSKDPKLPEFSQWHDYLASSEIWYYPTPRTAKNGTPLAPVEYGEAWYGGYKKSDGQYITVSQQSCVGRWYNDLYPVSPGKFGKWIDDSWETTLDDLENSSTKPTNFYFYHHDSINTNMRYFSFKVYRVDPLSRENIVESDVYGEDSPLIEVRYGVDTTNLKCKLPLKEVEQQIKSIQAKRGVPESERWAGFRSGEMYRVVMAVEEHVAFGYDHQKTLQTGKAAFGGELPVARTESSILFRCLSLDDLVETDPGEAYKATDFTPLQWIDAPEIGSRAGVQLLNGKAGMTDFKHVNKVFDIYYQWWEVEKDGTPVRMIAGTDNIYWGNDNDVRVNHEPKRWNNIEGDGHTYCNTFDPSDPHNANLIYNGLPGYYDDDGKLRADSIVWKCWDLHMYTDPTVNPEILKKGPGHLTPKNNNVYVTNSDTCYIPDEMSGKYVQVKAIVRCVEWDEYFDSLQTFKSKAVYIEPREELGTSWAQINKTQAVYGRTNNLSFTINGYASLIPEEKIRVQWQRRQDLSEVWEDIPGATKRTYQIPKERVYSESGMLYMGYRAHIDFEGYYGKYAHIDTNECKMTYYLPLRYTGGAVIPAGEPGEMIDDISLSDYIEDGTGSYVYTKYEGPSWLSIDQNGVISGTRPDHEQEACTLIVVVRDPELNQTVEVRIPVGKVFEPISGTLAIQGTPKPAYGSESPNVLTAVVSGTNSTKYRYEWYRDGRKPTYWVGNPYTLTGDDVGCTLTCYVYPMDGKTGRLEASVQIGERDGPDAPTLVPCYKKYTDGSVKCWIEVIDAQYPLEYDRSSSFSDSGVIESGDIMNLTPGTYYVRSRARFEQDPGKAATVNLTESSMLSLQTTRVPFGVTGESFETVVTATGGKPPYTFKISKHPNVPSVLGTIESIDGTSARVYGTFPESWYSSTLKRDLPYCPSHIDSVEVTDSNGNTASANLYYDGWDVASDHKKLDMEVTRFFSEFTQGKYTPGSSGDQIILLTNRSGVPLDMSGLTFRVTKKETDANGNEVEVDASDMFEFIPDNTKQILPPAKRYELRMRYKTGCHPGYTSGYIYVGGLGDVECDGYGAGNPGGEDGEAATYYSITCKAARLKDCTVEPIPAQLCTGSDIEPKVKIYDPDGVLLIEDKDYYVTYENNHYPGTATFTATAYSDPWDSDPEFYHGSVTGTFEIKQLTTSDKEIDVYVEAGTTAEQKLYYSSLVNDSFGSIANANFKSLDDPEHTLSSYRVMATGNINVTPSGTAKNGDTCSITFTVDTMICEPIQITMHIHYTDKRIPVLKIRSYQRTYDGTAIKAEDLDAVATVDGVPISGDWSFVDPADARLVRYTLGGTAQVLFTPEDQEKYAPAYGVLYIYTNSETTTGQPYYRYPYQGYVFQAGLSAEGGTFSVPGKVRWDDDVNPTDVIEEDKAYGWTFTPADFPNHNSISGKIVFYQRPRLVVSEKPDLTAEAYEKDYDGTPVRIEDIQKSARYNGEDVPGTWSFEDVTEADLTEPTSSSGYKWYLMKFIPEETDKYVPSYVGTWIKIKYLRPTGEPNWTRITEAGKTLSDVDLSTLGGTFSVPGTVSFDAPLDTEVKQDVAYPWTFKPADPYHYYSVYGSLIPWRSKEPVVLTVEPFTKTYDGKKVTLDQITKSAAFEGKPVQGAWSFADPGDARLTNAHEAENILLRFKPEEGQGLTDSEINLKLTINQAAITGRPAYTKITEAGKTLADSKLTTLGGSFTVPGTVYYELPEETEVEKDKAYTWYFVPSGGNYETLSGTVVPWGDVPEADKGALGSAVDDAGKIDKSKYTAESVAVLEAAVAAAKALQADPAATQAAVDAAAKAVRDAISGLVKSGGTPDNPFADVKAGAFYYDPVLWAVAHDPQITKGTDATHFSPDATCTRGQVVTFLWRAKGCPEPTKTDNPFSDVKEGAFYYKAVLWAVENGVTNGVDPTHFGPNQGCTRGQVVTFLWRAEGQPKPGSNANPFADVKGGFYYNAVLWAVEKNITKGTDATHFSPDKTCTRGQIVTFLYRDMK